MRAVCLRLCSLLLVAPLSLVLSLSAQNPEAQNPPPAVAALGSVSGQVLQEPGGMPVRKVEVSLVSASGIEFSSRGRQSSALSTVTDTDGHFHFDRVPAGDYRVGLQRNGFVSAGRRSQQDSPALISVANGQQLDGLLFRLLPAGVIRGKIVDEDGDPLQNVNVMAIAASGRGPSANAMTNDLGEYRLAGLAPGRYSVLAMEAGPRAGGDGSADAVEIYAPTFFPGTLERAQATTVEVHPGDEAEAGFGLAATRTFSVRGQVSGLSSGHAGSTEAGGSVLLQREGMPWTGATSAQVLPDGTFEIHDVPPGTYSAMVMSPTGSWRPAGGSEIIEVRGSDVNGLRLAPEPVDEIRGRFRMDDGQAFNWAQLNVYLDPDDGDSLQGALNGKVAKDGSFRIQNVPAGNYHVVVTADSDNLRDYIMKEVNVNGKDAGDSGFATGPGVSVLDIVASAKGSMIAGTVVDGDDKTVFDAQVVCIPDENRRKRHDVYQQARTDRRGQFSFRGLNPGEYIVFGLNGDASDITDPDFIQRHEAIGQRLRIDEGEKKNITVKFSWANEP